MARGRLWFIHALNLGSVLLAVNLLERNLGPVSPEWSRAIAACVLLIMLMANLRFPVRPVSAQAVALGVGMAGISLFFMVRAEPDSGAVAMCALVLLGMNGLARSLGSSVRGVRVLAAMALACAVVSWIMQTVPGLGDRLVVAGVEWSKWVDRVATRQNLINGPSGLGGGILATAWCYVAMRLVIRPKGRSESWRRWGAVSASLLVANGIYLWLQVRLIAAEARPLFFSQAIFLVLCWLVLIFGARISRAERRPSVRPKMALTAAVLLAVAAFGLSLWPGSRPGSSAKVLFYDSGFLDWDRPVYGRYGPFETGMFGSLQDYLAASGIRCELTRELSAASFQGVNALVVINPTNRWSDAQLESIWAYVESGGSLLVLGDHTDIMGSQAVLNTLLAPVNVRFKFDSGFPARPEWLNCLESLVHPTTWRASKTTETLISVGASLELQPPAFTVIWGRYGFSDLGNRLNTQGAFLGDYRHQRGEQLGDVSLVAAAYYGRGKVLVFGDTSPFQNGALASTFESFVQPVFAWLTMRDWRFWGVLKWIGAVLLVGSLGVLVQRGPVWASGAGGLLLAAMMTAGLAFERNRMPLPALEGSVAWIDLAHANRVALEPFQTDSIGPLPIALMRNGLLPLFKSRWSSEELHRASVVISTAPARRFSARKQRALSEFVRGGGVFLLNCGWDEKGDATKELLDQFGLDVLRIPLGPFPVTRTRDHLLNQPQCINAWAVAVTDPSAQADFEAARKQYRPVPLDTDQAQRLDEVVRGMFEIQGAPGPELLPPRSASSTVAGPETNRPPSSVEVLFQTDEGLPLILVRRLGKGAVVLIGDTFFLGHDNLENLQYYRKGNLLFLKHLFDTVRPGQI